VASSHWPCCCPCCCLCYRRCCHPCRCRRRRHRRLRRRRRHHPYRCRRRRHHHLRRRRRHRHRHRCPPRTSPRSPPCPRSTPTHLSPRAWMEYLFDEPFFFTSTGLANHTGWNTSLMNPAAISLWTSLPMALRFSSSKRRRCCFTGRAPARMSSECSATSLGMPGMSEGLHAKISVFAWRKSTSTASYLGSSSEPILTFLLASLLGSRETDLTASAGVERDGLNRGTPCKKFGVCAEKVDEHCFLFGVELGADPDFLAYGSR
jgi:hypothetical protein